MKEVQTPLDPKEVDQRLKQFPQAVRIFANSRDLLRDNSCDAYVAEDTRDGKVISVVVDGKVLKAMTGGIDRMYHDLVGMGFKGFADGVLDQYGQPRFSSYTRQK